MWGVDGPVARSGSSAEVFVGRWSVSPVDGLVRFFLFSFSFSFFFLLLPLADRRSLLRGQGRQTGQARKSK